MNKPIKVVVTEKHIKSGIASASQCPIALALRSLHFKNIAVCEFGNEVYVSYKKIRYSGSVTKRIKNLIVKFDDGKTIRPFSFNLKLLPIREVI